MKRTSVLLFVAAVAATVVAFGVAASVASAATYCQGSDCGASGQGVTPTNVDGNSTACPAGSQEFVFSPLSAVAGGTTLSQSYNFGGQSGTVSITISADKLSASFLVTGGALAVQADLHGGQGPPGSGGVNSTNIYNYGVTGVASDTGLRFPGPLSNVTICLVNGTVLASTTSSFHASHTGRAVTLRWQTASEANVIGFNVYRLVRGHMVKANHRIIAAASLSKSSTSHAYSFRTVLRSRKLAASSRFVLAEVHANGSRTLYGPVRASAS
jgi:hypothetical protein